LVSSPADGPGTADPAGQATLFPGRAEPAFDAAHLGLAIAAHSPALALALAQTSGVIAGKLAWCERADLRELAIQAVNHHFASDYSFAARAPVALAAGVSAAQQAALEEWRTSAFFADEQRLVIEYAFAAARGRVPPELFARLQAAFGARGAVECTAVIAFWSCWALFLNATGAGE
jgi:4-carboxymuconolactone decarboxylase